MGLRSCIGQCPWCPTSALLPKTSHTCPQVVEGRALLSGADAGQERPWGLQRSGVADMVPLTSSGSSISPWPRQPWRCQLVTCGAVLGRVWHWVPGPWGACAVRSPWRFCGGVRSHPSVPFLRGRRLPMWCRLDAVSAWYGRWSLLWLYPGVVWMTVFCQARRHGIWGRATVAGCQPRCSFCGTLLCCRCGTLMIWSCQH